MTSDTLCLPGAYLVPYFILLILIGIPLFFLELAVGQKIRRGSLGVWNYVCPRLGGIGVSSLMVRGTEEEGVLQGRVAAEWAGQGKRLGLSVERQRGMCLARGETTFR